MLAPKAECAAIHSERQGGRGRTDVLNVASVVFLVIAAAFLVVLPRRFAVIPVVLAAAYTTRNAVLELGPANLSVLRILVLVGITRVLARGERVANGVNAADRLLLAWAILLIGTSMFHTSAAWTYRIGMVLGELGVYFLCRVFVQDTDDVRRLFKVLSVALVPLAVLMLLEKYTGQNFFGFMGALSKVSMREGHVRATGPFAHPILAGTVGATCVPMALCLWRKHRVRALIGLCGAAGIVFASTSSGPIMMLIFTWVALLMWKVRDGLRLIRWGTVAAIIALDIVMKDPVYFLMARIDITGGSTGWFRAQLIRSSVDHLGEWWAVGTDYTRHWMASGISANASSTDITNHLLAMGVMGGLPLLILFVLVLAMSFRAVGRALRQQEDRSSERSFLIWTLGAMLFAQVINFWSISLFDQSVSFFYLVLAMIGAITLPVTAAPVKSLSGVPRAANTEAWTVRSPAVAPRKGGAVLPGRRAVSLRQRTQFGPKESGGA